MISCPKNLFIKSQYYNEPICVKPFPAIVVNLYNIVRRLSRYGMHDGGTEPCLNIKNGIPGMGIKIKWSGHIIVIMGTLCW